MDFIVEFLLQFFFGLFFEEPAEAIMGSKRLKPWAKTVLLFLAFNILTVILLVIYGVMVKDPTRASDAQAALYFAIAWGVIMTVLAGAPIRPAISFVLRRLPLRMSPAPMWSSAPPPWLI